MKKATVTVTFDGQEVQPSSYRWQVPVAGNLIKRTYRDTVSSRPTVLETPVESAGADLTVSPSDLRTQLTVENAAGESCFTGTVQQFHAFHFEQNGDYTARLVEAAEKTGADLVISPYTMVIPAGASKPEQVLEKIQDDLGVMHVARPPENREYGFLPEGVYDKDTFARRLMDKPASYFYSVLWNKLYRRDILTRHDIRFTSEMRWAEDLVFNMQYIQYAEVFASIPQPGYYYVQNPQSICHTQIKPATLVQNKIQVFHYYKDLYTRLGMYEQVRPQLYKFLIDIAESTYPSGPFKKVIDEAKAYWKEHKAELEQKL